MNRLIRAKFSVLFLAACLAIRLLAVGFIQKERTAPIEIDDSLSYLMHGSLLNVDPTFKSPLLQSFSELKVQMPQQTAEDFQRNRLFHRVHEFYHSGHSTVVAFCLKLGMDPYTLWWLLVYLLQAAFLLPLFSITKRHIGEAWGPFSLSLFVFSFGWVAHQLTAAPREWSAAGFFLSLWIGWSLKENSTVWRWLALAASVSICVSSHSIGRMLVAQWFGLMFVEAVFTRNLNLKRFLGIFACVAVGFLFEQLPYWLFGVPKVGSTPLEIIFDLSKMKSVFVNMLHQLSFLNVGEWPRKASGLLVFFVALGGAIRNVKFGLLLLSSVLLQIFTSFLALDYTPVVRWFTFEDYYYSVFLFACALCFSMGMKEATELFMKKLQKPATSRLLAFLGVVVFGVFALGTGYRVGATTMGLAKRGNVFEHPRALVKALEQRMQSKPSCVVVDNEVSLYTLMTFGNYQYSIAFNQYCDNPHWNYINKVDGKTCEYVFVSDSCPTLVQAHPITKAGVQWVGEKSH